MNIFSTPDQLKRIQAAVIGYAKLPFSGDATPGALLEYALAHVRSAERLNTYDFVDVVDRVGGCGWQVKSTKAATPVTWKRAKIPDAEALKRESRNSVHGLQKLGDAIIEFCNRHVRESIETYKLNAIGYCRLVVRKDGTAVYFERLLCTKAAPQLFDPKQFTWRWSEPKKTIKKEQLPALHGLEKVSGKKWWAWHGLGENQLHFSGESGWWPKPNNVHATTFKMPTPRERLSPERFLTLLTRLDRPA